VTGLGKGKNSPATHLFFTYPGHQKLFRCTRSDKSAGMMAELNEIVTFRLDKVEKGVGDVVYATYREID
jgi:hypothetical protein